jgi:flagellar biosynthesis/type III secretory pathway chaperone
MITASCGHTVKSLDDEYQIYRKDYDRLNHRAVTFDVVCLQCKQMYQRGGDLLETEAERQAWLRGSDGMST